MMVPLDRQLTDDEIQALPTGEERIRAHYFRCGYGQASLDHCNYPFVGFLIGFTLGALVMLFVMGLR